MMLTQKFKIKTAPSLEPVSREQFLEFARIRGCVNDSIESPDDDILNLLISSARTEIEKFTGLIFNETEIELWLDSYPIDNSERWWSGTVEAPISYLHSISRFFYLPLNPVISVDAFDFFMPDDSEHEFTGFRLDDVSVPAKIVLNQSATWPSNLRNSNAMRITYKAGMGADAPSDMKNAVLMLATFLYENRGMTSEKMPVQIRTLLNKHKVRWNG